MTRKKKPSGNETLKTGNQFIQHARERGAVVKPDQRGGFTEVSTREGSTYIAPGDQPLDPRTRKNLRHWFRLLGLLSIAGVLTFMLDVIWGLLHLPPLW